ncbi:MAG TPA: 50S ribosomal protein L5 [Candidatus Paceibacterota bacterium]|nr:50S ribosomal protein L5 [Candidatus Paceibacterota bacterium]
MDEKKEKIKNNIEKIVVNTGVGKLSDKAHFKDKLLPDITEEISLITGQKPSLRRAKKSIAGFDVRQGDVVGLKVTLRGKRMIDFLMKLNNVAMPRLRDFKGIGLNNIDQNGNLNIGFEDQSVFPEINMDKSKIDFGLQVNIVPFEKDREKAVDIYRDIGVPLKKDKSTDE